MASIDVVAFKYNELTFKAVLDYINQLFKQGFPKSHRLEFQIKNIDDQEKLSIPHIGDSGGNQLFNSAAKFHDLHEDILTYIKLVDSRGFYTHLTDADYIEVGGFAVFSLVLEDFKYVDLFNKFLDQANDHSLLQNYISSIFLDRNGISNESVRAYLQLCEALLQHENFHPVTGDFLTYFNNVASMRILLEEVNRYSEEEHKVKWGDILVSILGFGLMEDCSYDLYALKHFKSIQILALYRKLEEKSDWFK